MWCETLKNLSPSIADTSERKGTTYISAQNQDAFPSFKHLLGFKGQEDEMEVSTQEPQLTGKGKAARQRICRIEILWMRRP